MLFERFSSFALLLFCFSSKSWLVSSALKDSSCNFDTSMCGFVQDSNDTFDWTRRRGSTPSSPTGPSGDHTKGNGYYMHIETSSPRQPGDYAKLNSPKLQFNGNMCILFYYHMYGVNVGTLTVNINGNSVFSASGNKGDKWLRAAIDVNFSGKHSVTFQATKGLSYLNDIAIDDFELESGPCLSFGCDFDTSVMCGFVQDSNDDFDWWRHRGSTPSSFTGPSGDHTTEHTTGSGYYMYMEASSRQPGDFAKLNSPKLRFDGSMCLQFFYHMYGADMGTLTVIINGKSVFNASGDEGDKWLKAEVNITLSGNYVVTFEGMRGSGYLSDIAIDDFLLKPGSCSSMTTNTNPVIPAVTTPTITVPSATVRSLQSTVASSSDVTSTLREETTTASKESVIPTRSSGATKATTKAVNDVLNTTTIKVPLSVSYEQPAVAAQAGGEEYFQDGKPVCLSTSVIVALSVASVIVVVGVVILLHRRRKRRYHCPDKGDKIPLRVVVIDENLCNQDFYGPCKYDVLTAKCDAIDFNLANQGAV